MFQHIQINIPADIMGNPPNGVPASMAFFTTATESFTILGPVVISHCNLQFRAINQLLPLY